MSLAVDRLGPTRPPETAGRGPNRLILAHGFTQNSRCWGPFADHLASGNALTLVDAPGHGRSGHDQADLWEAADLLVEAGGPGCYIGYSMGGRTALHAALTHPDVVDGLVLIGATAGLDTEDQRAERRQADEALAQRLLDQGLGTFVEQWLANPLFAGLTAQAAAADHRLANRPDGLAASLRHAGTGSQGSLWSRLGELTMPVLLLVGDDDHKFTDLAQRMAQLMTSTSAEVASLPGTHAVHLEQPSPAAALIDKWLARHEAEFEARHRARHDLDDRA